MHREYTHSVGEAKARHSSFIVVDLHLDLALIGWLSFRANLANNAGQISKKHKKYYKQHLF